MNKRLSLLALIATGFITACAGTPSNDPTDGPSGSANRNAAALPTSVTLAPGSSIEVTQANLNIRFDSIVTDSRCPTDVQCVWAGEAVAALSIGQLSGEMSLRLAALSTTSGRDTTTAYGKPIKLLKVTPAPDSKNAIAKSAYRIELQVSPPK